MISIRQSAADKSNPSLKELKPKPRETNSAWLKRAGATDGLLLLGGASIADFRIRVAQSHARADLTPSCWSLVGILLDESTFLSVPLELSGSANEIALGNGVQTCNLADYDDPDRFPNVAVIRFTPDSQKIIDFSRLIGGNPETKKPAQRSIIDLPTTMLPWLAYIWIAGKADNPLVDGLGLPSAAFVETVYGMAGIELTPGLASATSCPEAIWQAAKYWHDFYEEAAETTSEQNAAQQIPKGSFAIRQRAAAVTWPKED
ncbi:MAG TPA: hypothetical protein VJT15_22765 [Pyrinomonadaceae bacterium]|nr:hypothetical protein [Pyrinomonadaceae bacterium]